MFKCLAIRRSNLSVILLTAVVVSLFFMGGVDSALGKSTDQQQAKKVVKGFLRASGNSPLKAELGNRVGRVETFSDDAGEAIYHVVYLVPGGFVIVGADDLVEPIIAFSAGGEYDGSESNPLGAMVGRDMPGRMRVAKDIQKEIDAGRKKLQSSYGKRGVAAKEKWDKLSSYADGAKGLSTGSISDVRVGPLLLSTWNQEGATYSGPTCYNYYTPSNYPTGCVATAMAQVMRYHEHPTGGVGSKRFTISVNGVNQYAWLKGGDGSGGAYNWSMMPYNPTGAITLPERQAIGAICYDAGVSVEMSYSSGSSSASLSDTDDQLVDTFDYSNCIFGYNNYNEIGSGLTNMINPNLDAGQVVVFGVSRTGGGHAVVCDGYGYSSSTLYHHINMGWGGSDNAWYDLPIIDAYYTYNVVDTCLYNIFTGGSGEIISGRVVDMASNPMAGVSVRAVSDANDLTVTTDANGIYAFKAILSNKNYAVTASKTGHAFMSQNVYVGMSQDGQKTAGNVWGVDFVSTSSTPPVAYDGNASAFSGAAESITLPAADEGNPNPPGELSYSIMSLPEYGVLVDPGVGEIAAVPYLLGAGANVVEYTSCSYFAGQDSFGFVADDGGSEPTGGQSNVGTMTIDIDNKIYTTTSDEESWYSGFPLIASYHDARSQVIYLQSDVGVAQSITDLALNVRTGPGQSLNNWTIRMKHTTKNYYTSTWQLESTGWTTVYSGTMSTSPTGWRNFHFQTPFAYDGVDNLMVDFCFNNSYSSSDGFCFITDTGSMRMVAGTADSDAGNPLYWDSGTYGIWGFNSDSVPNIKLIGEVGGTPKVGDFQSDCKVDFRDFAILGAAWLSNSGSGNWDGRCDISLPGDGQVNLADLRIWCEHYLE